MSFLFPSTTITFEAALRDVVHGNPRARTFAAHALGDVRDPAEVRRAVDALVAALDDERFEVRAEACSSLGELAERGAVPALIRRLADAAAPVRQNAAIALGSIADPAGFEPLAAALRDAPADLRFQAATSLVEIDAPRAFEPLAAALRDRDPQVVSAAVLAIAAIPEATGDAALAARARTLLLEELEHGNSVVRFDVAYGLAQLGEPAGRHLLVRALTEVDHAWDAVSALALLGKPEDVAALGAALEQRGVPPEATVLAAGAVLRLGGPAEPARRVLLAALAARKDQIRGLAIEQLAEVGGAWASGPLEKLERSRKGRDLLEPIGAALRAIRERG